MDDKQIDEILKSVVEFERAKIELLEKNQFVGGLYKTTRELLTETDKKKFENPNYTIKINGFDISYTENNNYKKVSFEKDEKTSTITLKSDYVRTIFFSSLKKEFGDIDEVETYGLIQKFSLFREFNYVVSEFVKNNNHLFL